MTDDFIDNYADYVSLILVTVLNCLLLSLFFWLDI